MISVPAKPLCPLRGVLPRSLLLLNLPLGHNNDCEARDALSARGIVAQKTLCGLTRGLTLLGIMRDQAKNIEPPLITRCSRIEGGEEGDDVQLIRREAGV